MRIHHLNCGCMCPLGGRMWDGVSHGLRARLVCHCLLIETDDGLVLVDTGFGTRDVDHPYERLSPLFVYSNNIQFDRRDTALEQIEDLGSNEVEEYVLVYPDRANIAEGRLSILAPVGTALIGARSGAIVDWPTPGGIRRLKIHRVTPPDDAPAAARSPSAVFTASR